MTRISLMLSFLLVAGSLPLGGQQYNAQDFRLQLANLTQDVRQLTRTVGVLQVELEQLQRENADLKRELVSQKELGNKLAELQVTISATATALRKDFRAADEAQKEVIVKEVSRQITELAKQTQEALKSLGEYAGFRGSGVPQVNFSDDYPSNGVAYEVKRGDTLSGIARKFGSSVRDIQNANRIADPAALKAGDTIFVPIPDKD